VPATAIARLRWQRASSLGRARKGHARRSIRR
jgi:hypothetical protein